MFGTGSGMKKCYDPDPEQGPETLLSKISNEKKFNQN
jgi:hypothetical protein